jgi:hypothetical protein
MIQGVGLDPRSMVIKRIKKSCRGRENRLTSLLRWISGNQLTSQALASDDQKNAGSRQADSRNCENVAAVVAVVESAKHRVHQWRQARHSARAAVWSCRQARLAPARQPAPKPCPPRNEGHPMTNYKSHSQPEAARKSHLRFFCDESSKVTSRWRRFPTFMVFAGFSVLEFAVLSTIKVDTSDLDFWIVVAGAIFFPVLAILSLLSIWNNWTREQEDRAFNVLRYMCLIPIILGGAMLVSVGLFLFWGWLGIIPSWAAVIAIFLKN